MNEKDYKHSEITGKIIGAAMKVHSTLGNGFQEVIYQRALDIELAKCRLLSQPEVEVLIYYDGQEIGRRRVDFFCGRQGDGRDKSADSLEDVHLAQAINYLEAYGLEIGLLINFGAKSLQYRRVINSKHLRNQGNQP